MESISRKNLRSLENKPFKLPSTQGTFKIKPLLSSFFLEKDGNFHGSVIPWLSTPSKLHITFSHCGNTIDSAIKLSDMIFMITFNYKTNESIRSSKRA